MRRVLLTGCILGASAAVLMFGATRDAFSRPARERAAKEVIPTFNRDIAPIVFSHCANCHRPGQTGPFSLLSYRDALAKGKALAAVTTARTMPPWKAMGDCAFRDENRLTTQQIALVGKWVNNGMPEGRAADRPAPPKFPEGWQLGTPDLVVKMDRPYHVPADGPDIYRHFVLPLNLTEDKWLAAIEYHPKARTVVHHCLFFYDTSGTLRQRDGLDGQPGIGGGMSPIPGGRGGGRRFGGGGGQGTGGGLHRHGGFGGGALEFGSSGSPANPAPFGGLGGWAVGALPRMLPDGLAYYLPKGSDLLLSTHFHPSGKAEDEISEVGLYFAKVTPTKQFTGMQFPPAFGALSAIDIPPGAKEYTIQDTFTLPVDVKAFGASGHAHFIGRDMLLTATFPDGTTKTLLSIPKWEFAWQGQYQYKQFVDLPKGTKLHAVIHYDNSAENPNNPSRPPREVRWGEQTTDEMGSLILQVVAAKDAELPALRTAYQEHVRSVAMANPAFFGRMLGGGGGRE